MFVKVIFFNNRISGPNTGQEWSKEGRRNFPLLSRNVPHTALATIANNARDIALTENLQLQIPSETTRDFTGDELSILDKPVVTEDPVSFYYFFMTRIDTLASIMY